VTARSTPGWSVDALRAVWARQREQVLARIAVLALAVGALAGDRLEADLRCDAERCAHTLAGSLGMFGLVGAADAARELERELAHPTPQRAPLLSVLLEQVRRGVREPVFVSTAGSRRSD
jgi:HPt (histidine-containing phosphotransfer) domain-containing protein